MDTIITPPPVPAPPAPSGLVAALLKDPPSIARTIADRVRLPVAALFWLVAGFAGLAVFGIAVGLFGGRTVAAMDALKMPLVGFCSLLLCLPSLYVFSCVTGMPLSLAQTLALGSACFAMMGLILVGLAPVAWLFAVSTSSFAFVVMLTFFLWLIAIGFTGRFVEKLRSAALFQRQAGLKLWFVILLLVTLQMTTCMRPMLAKPGARGWWTSEKQFFLSHFVHAVDADE